MNRIYRMKEGRLANAKVLFLDILFILLILSVFFKKYPGQHHRLFTRR